ncbi:DUF397 domain-containing protein [Streptomyces montanisoli]|uniref:DUF397 domain-containing protein n=1 Tax=Streptomyces montanisoli TaxID=2798581 RepID=A0A940MDL3_9ACTN|nr:DUF397 domain-containing protein [Streptomyces montanisoli]MBP0459077.1 DUF397 domain-containing protein [Streptomyces montanisoli]
MNTDLTWFKSSYSNTSGGNCVEVALAWRTSTYSSTGGGECVEVATCPGVVHVRDSKLRDNGQLAVPAASWADFVAFARRG